MKLLGRLVVVIVALGCVSVAQAVPTIFTLENSVFEDGAFLNGTFSIDYDDMGFFAVDLTSSYGSDLFPGSNFSILISRLYTGSTEGDGLTAFRIRDATGTFDLFLRFDSPLFPGITVSDIVIDPRRSFELAVTAGTTLTRNVISGRVTSVPEPSTLALFVISLAGMGLARRRKTT